MRRACAILVTTALLWAHAHPLLAQGCCSAERCCGSDLCPMKARPAAKPAKDEMECHKSSQQSAPEQGAGCTMKSGCRPSELSGILPDLPRAIVGGRLLLPRPQADRRGLISSVPAISAGFSSPPRQPPRF